MKELLTILKPLSHLQGFRIVNNELVFQWQGAEVLFWIREESEGFEVFAGSEKQFVSSNSYKVAQFLSLLGF